MTSTRRDRLGAIGHGRDRLGAADPVELVHPGEARRREHLVGDRAVGPGGTQTATASTPATRAGMALMSTLEG